MCTYTWCCAEQREIWVALKWTATLSSTKQHIVAHGGECVCAYVYGIPFISPMILSVCSFV